MTDQRSNNQPAGKPGLSTFIAGVIIGATITYLFGTKKGKKLKNELVKEGSRLVDKIAENLEEAKEELASTAEDIKEEVPQHIEQIQKKGRRFFFRKKHEPLES